MQRKTSRFAAVLASVAACSMIATPALANHNSGWGWGGGWGYRHRDRVDVGDVLTGVLIIGAIAAVADAATKNSRNRRYEPPRRDARYPGGDYRRDDNRDYGRDYGREDSRPEWRGDSQRGASAGSANLNGAIDRCLSEASRGGGNPQVDSVARDGQGWLVTGRTGRGDGFTCTVDSDGRLRDIDMGGRSD